MLKQGFLRWMVIFSVLVAVCVPALNLCYVYPYFAEHAIAEVEKNAVQLSRLMSRVILFDDNWNDWISKGMMPDYIRDEILEVVGEISLAKLKFFLADGRAIYSTDIEDVGKTNTHDYFHRQVARGETYAKLVRKDHASLEGQRYRQDVVEVYVPVMKSGSFRGAFELYIDVTDKMAEMRDLLLRISVVPTLVILLFLGTQLFLAGKLRQFMRKRRKSEEDLAEALDTSWKLNEQLESNHLLLSHQAEELAEANRQLKATQSQMLQQEKMASIGQLAAGVAHEINNPIGFIGSNLNTLRKYFDKVIDYDRCQQAVLRESLAEGQVRDLEQQRRRAKLDLVLADIPDLLAESLDGAERVREIVQNLKIFSRVDEAERKPADINQCLESTLKIVWNELKYKARVTRELAPLPPLVCYPQQLNQVFMNILVNGAHAIEKEGEITVRTSCDQERIMVQISDTGCGMPPEVQERIFEPFYTTKEVGKGTGLGMSIAWEIVQKHRGNIVINSEVGVGTTFEISLPINAVEAEGLAEEGRASNA